ncbi:MAG: hypothetical protein Q7R39_02605 [Dehalococcoidia bacterium]|nr:hypothetical protein [Dehalococcoidia bacterium]
MKRMSWLLALIMVLTALPLGSSRVGADAPDFDIPGGHFFTQTNGQGGAGSAGFGITDDIGIGFWSQFQALGGVNKLGYPSSQRFMYRDFFSQATQKYILQWQQGAVYFVNIFDELSSMGKDDYLLTVRSIPKPASFVETGQSFNQITASRLALLDANPAIKAAYMADPDPVRAHGLPTSQVVDVGPAYVIRNQRDVIQQWKIDEPWAKAGDVTFVNGGDIAKETGLVPLDAATPQPVPGTTPAPSTPIAPQPAPAPSPVASQFPYNPLGVTWEPNCGLVQIKVHIQQANGFGINDLRVMVAAAAGGWSTVSVPTGQESRDIGWTNVVLRTDPVNEPWSVWVIDGAGNRVSPVVNVTTDTNDCVPTGIGHQVAAVTFVNAPAPAPATQPAQPGQPAAPAVPQAFPYISGFVSWEPNCGLTAVKIKVIDQSGNPVNGLLFHIESGDGTWSATSQKTGSESYSDGMTDFVLRQEPVAEPWKVWAIAPGGFRLSDTVWVPTDTGPCLPGEEGHQVASLQFQQVGAVVTPTPTYPYTLAGVTWTASCTLTQLNFRIRDKAGNPVDGLKVRVKTDGDTWVADSLPTGTTGQGPGMTNLWINSEPLAVHLTVFIEDKDSNPMSNPAGVDTTSGDCSGSGQQVGLVDFVRN